MAVHTLPEQGVERLPRRWDGPEPLREAGAVERARALRVLADPVGDRAFQAVHVADAALDTLLRGRGARNRKGGAYPLVLDPVKDPLRLGVGCLTILREEGLPLCCLGVRLYKPM